MTVAACPECATPLWWPREVANRRCDYCRKAALAKYWTARFANELDIREAFGTNGNAKIPDSAGAPAGGLHHLPPRAGRTSHPAGTIRNGEVRSNRRQ